MSIADGAWLGPDRQFPESESRSWTFCATRLIPATTRSRATRTHGRRGICAQRCDRRTSARNETSIRTAPRRTSVKVEQDTPKESVVDTSATPKVADRASRVRSLGLVSLRYGMIWALVLLV